MSARPRGGRIGGDILPRFGELEPNADRVELLGLGVLVTVFERLSSDERRRALAYLADRFGDTRVAIERAQARLGDDIRVANQLAALRSARDEIMEHVENVAGDGEASVTFQSAWLRTLLDGLGS